MNVEKDVKELRKALTGVFKRFGLRDVDACVLAQMFIIDRETTVEELAKTLRYSISGVTSALHRLMKMHLVTRTKVGKKYLYRSESSILTALLHLIEDIRMHELRNLKAVIVRKIKDGESEIAIRMKERVERAERNLEELANILREHERRDAYENRSHRG